MKKTGVIPGVLFFTLLCLTSLYLLSQETGYKYFKNYSPKEYDHYAQNWGFVQAGNGIVYVANQAGVLEFDGVSWRVIYPPNRTVRSLAISEKGNIYVGGKGEIGYLAPDEKGTLTYNSLLEYLPGNQLSFPDVWKTCVIGKNVYFDTRGYLFQWDSVQKKLTALPRNYNALLNCEGKLFIRSDETGLERIVKIESGGLKTAPIAGGEAFAAKKISMLTPYDHRKLLIGTRGSGLYIHDGKTTTSFPTDADGYLKEKKLYHGIRRASGDFALATRLGGLVIIDANGRLKYIFNKTSGLQDENVKKVFEDNRGNLWLALENGISMLEYNSPFFLYDDRSGLPGLILSVIRHRGDLFVGTSDGLYVLHAHSGTFRNVLDILDNCWDLLSIDDSILAATTRGVFQVEENSKRKIIGDLAYVVLSSERRPDRIWCGTGRGLTALTRENNRWIVAHRFETINEEIRSIVEEKDGRLWLGLKNGVLKVDFPDGTDEPAADLYNKSGTLSLGGVHAVAAAGHTMFASEKGIFRFDKETRTLVPDGTLGSDYSGGPESKQVFRILEDKNKNIWLHSEGRNYLAVPGPGGTFTIHSQHFRRIPTTSHVNAFYPDPDGKTTWFATNDGLIRYNESIKKNYSYEFQTLIRKVVINGKLFFYGSKDDSRGDSHEVYPIIDYKDRNLRFEFAAPFFEAENETRYQCFLEGYDDGWSVFNKDSVMNYTNLDAGVYTFRVRAKSVYEHQGKEDVFRFKVLPPWYQTWWAYLIYGIGFLFLMFFSIKWRSRRLEHEKQKLEQIVETRTKEVNEKNQQLKQQTVKLKDQSEKLKEMDKVKSGFFANISHEFRTPLTLIMGPIERMLSQNRDENEKNTLDMMLQNSQRLLTLINQLLDLSRFDSGKMKLKAARQNIVPFLNGILASFRMVAQRNEIKLEFLPKEDAIPLYFDSQKLEEVMYNLLINAVKFTPPGGRITINVSREGEEPPGFVKISVQDTGIGIPKDQLSHIFDRFYQVGHPGEKGHKGTGIGLALTKEIVTLHHGKIDVHSREKKGTEFVIRIPTGNDHLESDEITAAGTVSHDKKEKEIEALQKKLESRADGYVPIEPGTAPGDNGDKQEKNVILVVEDHPHMRKYIREPLEPDYTVVEACDGKEGMAKAREITPDLIVSDIMMPEAGGYELCRQLKKDIKTCHIPIILLTAKASDESVIRGLETGADDYITKPFNTEMLVRRIKNLIELRRQLQLKIQREKMLLPSEISVSSTDEKFLNDFQGIIEKNLSNEALNVDMLCDKLFMSRSNLFRKIQALTGETPNQFILSYRLERSAQLLKGKYGNITEVALEVGFNSPAYFSKCFKEKFHQSPSSFQSSESSVSNKS